MKESFQSMADIAQTIRQSCGLMKQLPSVRVQGYFNLWSKMPIGSQKIDTSALQECPEIQELPMPKPSPKEIDLMWEVCFKWLYFLKIEDRKLVWDRCSGMGWKALAYKYKISRSTAIRRFNESCAIIYKQIRCC